jgi:hypothetical protein
VTYFADLTRCTYFDRRYELDLIAVGWLSSGPHAQGPVAHGLVAHLFDLLDTVWDPVLFRGSHGCELCRSFVDEMQDAGRTVRVGQTNLFVPTLNSEGLFVAPSLILHYIVDHGYCPPESFQAALMACPRTDSVEYFRRIGTRALPEDWRDEQREALGAALARRAGLTMDKRELWRLYDRVGHVERHTPRIPPWFEQEHLAPIRVLVTDLESRGETSDAEAVRTWLNSLALNAEYMAPEDRPDGES